MAIAILKESAIVKKDGDTVRDESYNQSLRNTIVGGPDYEHADFQEKIVLQRGNEIQELRGFWCRTEGGLLN